MKEIRDYLPAEIRFRLPESVPCFPEILFPGCRSMKEVRKKLETHFVAVQEKNVMAERLMDEYEISSVREIYGDILEEQVPALENELNRIKSEFNTVRREYESRISSLCTQAKDLISLAKKRVRDYPLRMECTFRIPVCRHYLYYTWVNEGFVLALVQAIPEDESDDLFNSSEKNEEAFLSLGYDLPVFPDVETRVNVRRFSDKKSENGEGRKEGDCFHANGGNREIGEETDCFHANGGNREIGEETDCFHTSGGNRGVGKETDCCDPKQGEIEVWEENGCDVWIEKWTEEFLDEDAGKIVSAERQAWHRVPFDESPWRRGKENSQTNAQAEPSENKEEEIDRPVNAVKKELPPDEIRSENLPEKDVCFSSGISAGAVKKDLPPDGIRSENLPEEDVCFSSGISAGAVKKDFPPDEIRSENLPEEDVCFSSGRPASAVKKDFPPDEIRSENLPEEDVCFSSGRQKNKERSKEK